MLRIAHISDLHIRDPQLDNDQRSAIQSMANLILEKIGVHIEAGGHAPEKLIALSAHLKALRPDVIVVTGDITNFGDQASFDAAGKFLVDLKRTTGARSILCVPGNHDCLVERAALVKQFGSRRTRAFLWLLGKVNRETDVIQGGAERQFFGADWRPTSIALMLENYAKFCQAYGFGTCDPCKPVEVDAKWGSVSFFPFNSVNGPGLMANKGEIGSSAFIRFGNFRLDSSWERHQKAVRIALLHHHPISAPQSLDADANRAYDWMVDGPRLLNVLNAHKFHFVLHGHQHEPFTCSVDYGNGPGCQTLIVAAGSASQGTHTLTKNSFNVIDLITPFQARVRRFDFGDTGFSTSPAMDRIFPLAPIEDVRLGDSQGPATVEDWALQALVRNSFRDFDGLGEAFAYEELCFDVTITPNHLYKARYRRKGFLKDATGELGPIFVITGSPAMASVSMQLEAFDHLAGGKALGAPALLRDEPNYKVVRVLTRQALSVGDTFDVELSFVWQASSQEPNNFDAVSLMGFRHPVKRLKYKVCVPWQASQIRLRTINSVMAQISDVSLTSDSVVKGQWRYGFELDDPPPVAYLFEFRK